MNEAVEIRKLELDSVAAPKDRKSKYNDRLLWAKYSKTRLSFQYAYGHDTHTLFVTLFIFWRVWVSTVEAVLEVRVQSLLRKFNILLSI